MRGVGPLLSVAVLGLAVIALAAPLARRAPSAAPARGSADRSRAVLDASVDRLLDSGFGFDLAVAVYRGGDGVLYERAADEPRPAASAIKSFLALDLLSSRTPALDAVPAQADEWLRPGGHPAFEGFAEEALARCRAALAGRTYRELARIMMGRTDAPNDVYNAACNLVMIGLGGPASIHERIHRMDPRFAGVDVNRYMLTWHADGDNLASPHALVALYRMTAEGTLPGLDAERQALFREWLLDPATRSPRYEKPGTLYPEPMVRVRAGYEERGDRDLVYAIMGTMENHREMAPEDAFVLLLAAVDTLTSICRELP